MKGIKNGIAFSRRMDYNKLTPVYRETKGKRSLLTMFDERYFFECLKGLLDIDSTTGQFREIQDWLLLELNRLGYESRVCRKGGVIVPFGGETSPIAVTAHLDDIGLMVRKLNADGSLQVCPVGGLYPFYCMGMNVRLHTRDDRIYTGTVCRTPASVHVTEDELRKTAPDYRSNVCVVLDEPVHTPAEVRALGIETGDMIALEPRFTRAGGYIKSHFLDDKACAALLLALMKELKEAGLAPRRKAYAYFAMYEEIGHGTTWLPEDVEDILALDIAPTGPDQTSDEEKVSIFAKDTRFPYHWEMTNELVRTAGAAGLDYAVDIFTPHYATDADASVLAGYDVRHAAIGPGTANSHGYERMHINGIRNTYELLRAYLLRAE